MGKEVSVQIPPQVIKGIRMCIFYMKALFWPLWMQLRALFLALMRDPHLKVEPQQTLNTRESNETSISGEKNPLCQF